MMHVSARTLLACACLCSAFAADIIVTQVGGGNCDGHLAARAMLRQAYSLDVWRNESSPAHRTLLWVAETEAH
ncbi:hypothetical protein EON67_02310, partial [archaeon]